MEFSERVIAGERILVGVFLTALVAAAAWESRSAVSWAVRRSTPYTFVLSLEEPGARAPRRFWARYQPSRRALDLILLSGSPPSGLPEPSGELALRGVLPADEEAPVAAATWLESELRGVRFWTQLLPRLLARGGDLPLADRVTLALELRRLPREGVRPAFMPEESALPGLLERLDAPPEPADGERPPITVEVVNASGRKGLASEATKVLRLHGADAVPNGNTPAPARRTLVLDRAGRFENAAAVRRMLGCPGAAAVTQVNLRSLVDVSVLVAEDCAGSASLKGAQ